MPEATRRIDTLRLPGLAIAALASAVLFTCPVPALGQEDFDKATPKLAEAAAHPVTDFGENAGPEGLYLTLSDRFAREKLTRGRLIEPVPLREVTENLAVRVGDGVKFLNSQPEYVCTAALVRNGRAAAVHTSQPFKVESGRTASAGKHCVPGDQRRMGDQWNTADQWVPAMSTVFLRAEFNPGDGYNPPLDGSSKTAAELGSLFGTWAAKTVQACCVGKHDALVVAVFPMDRRMIEGDPDRPLIVLFTGSR